MSIAKVIELMAEGDSIEAAVQSAVTEASKTVRNVRHIYVEHIQAIIENNQVVRYRLNCKLTFVVGEPEDIA